MDSEMKRKNEMTTIVKNSKALKGFRTHSIVMIGLLVVQYILGMITNLFVKLPEDGQPAQVWAAANSQFPSAAHIILGMLLLIVAIVIIVRAVMSKNRTLVWISVAGLAAIAVATYGGIVFTTGQSDTYSLVMALGFIASLVVYVWGLIAARN
jgi:heme A synthase